LIKIRGRHGLAVIKDNLLFDVGGCHYDVLPVRNVDVLDLSSESPEWQPSVDMLVERDFLGVGVINDKIYAVSNNNLLVYLLFLLKSPYQ